MEMHTLHGADASAVIADVARLRIEVFADYPYLYDGDLAYERDYLSTYLQSKASTLVLAKDGTRIVGASTAVPLREADAAFRAPFDAKGIEPGRVYYFGESVLDPAYRGRGLGHRFFDERERVASSLGYELTAFCAVERPEDHPRRPAGYRDLEAFWRGRGYVRQDDMRARFKWREVGGEDEVSNTLVFFIREG